MGTAVWQPKWWTKDQHESNWERVKDALKRDWEQTKIDLKGQGSDLDQDVDDTVKQALGKDVIPPMGQANVPGGTPAVDTKSRKWDDVESPFKYGVGARHQYGSEHKTWDDNLEGKLKSEWESDTGHGTWSDVKSFVRRGWDKVVG